MVERIKTRSQNCSFKNAIYKWVHFILSHPLTRSMDIDDPRTTQFRRYITKEKAFLRQIYQEWYEEIAAVLPSGKGQVLELGSGPGFMKDFIPDLITSDIFICPGLKLVFNGCCLPIAESTLRGIVMTNVLHHMPDAPKFFNEAARCVRVGGVIVMIEPWVTSWSRFVYSKLHHEPFLPDAKEWEFSYGGPLSGANAALAWIIFERERIRFETQYPQWQIVEIKPFMPFRYLLSGGISMRSLMPGWTFSLCRKMENILEPWMKTLAMFAKIILVRVDKK